MTNTGITVGSKIYLRFRESGNRFPISIFSSSSPDKYRYHYACVSTKWQTDNPGDATKLARCLVWDAITARAVEEGGSAHHLTHIKEVATSILKRIRNAEHPKLLSIQATWVKKHQVPDILDRIGGWRIPPYGDFIDGLKINRVYESVEHIYLLVSKGSTPQEVASQISKTRWGLVGADSEQEAIENYTLFIAHEDENIADLIPIALPKELCHALEKVPKSYRFSVLKEKSTPFLPSIC